MQRIKLRQCNTQRPDGMTASWSYLMTNKQKIEAAKARIKELERLIKCWEK